MNLNKKTVYGKTKSQLLKNITTEKVKLNQTEVDFIRLLTQDKQKILRVLPNQEKLFLNLPQWKLRQEVDALNDFDLKARKTIRVAGYEKERKNSIDFMPKGIGTEIKKQNKKIDKLTAQVLKKTFEGINKSNKLEGKKVMQERFIDFEKIAKIIGTDNSTNRAYAPKSVIAKLPKSMKKGEKKRIKAQKTRWANEVKEKIHHAKTEIFNERRTQGKENILKMMERSKAPWIQSYINKVKRFNKVQIEMIFNSWEFFKYGKDLFYSTDDEIRFQAMDLIDFIGENKKVNIDKNKEDTLIDSKEAIKNEYISTTNTMRKQRKKAKK